eukprot:GFYU01003245.1.p1 GENE.GFYU01003245.1~~GFYU01003245.1.p1  ORF type:complete len:252 (-),score=91.26 GFYU01003245.1:60-815(-)
MEEHSVARLIGSPPGYVGHEEGGQLTEKVRRHPYSVVLFDEIEKAHPRVLNILLQVLDDGRLTDGKGQTVNFANTVVIMTSNLGAELITSHAQGVSEQTKEAVINRIRSVLSPEFLNRLDEIIVFNSLGVSTLNAIIHKHVATVAQRLEDRNIRVTVDEAALAVIKAQAYIPSLGARPLSRFIEKHISTGLSRLILAGDLENNMVVNVSADATQSKLAFSVEALPAEETDADMMDTDSASVSSGPKKPRYY